VIANCKIEGGAGSSWTSWSVIGNRRLSREAAVQPNSRSGG
jgi:hypothetical protein